MINGHIIIIIIKPLLRSNKEGGVVKQHN